MNLMYNGGFIYGVNECCDTDPVDDTDIYFKDLVGETRVIYLSFTKPRMHGNLSSY